MSENTISTKNKTRKYICGNECAEVALTMLGCKRCNTYYCSIVCAMQHRNTHENQCFPVPDLKDKPLLKRYLVGRLQQLVAELPKLFTNETVFASCVRKYILKYVLGTKLGGNNKIIDYRRDGIFSVTCDIETFVLIHSTLNETWHDSSDEILEKLNKADMDTLCNRETRLEPFHKEQILLVQRLVSRYIYYENISKYYAGESLHLITSHLDKLLPHVNSLMAICFEVTQNDPSNTEVQCVFVTYCGYETPDKVLEKMLDK